MDYVMQCKGNIGKSVLIVGLMVLSVMPVQAEQTPGWEFQRAYDKEFFGFQLLNVPLPAGVKSLCLYFSEQRWFAVIYKIRLEEKNDSSNGLCNAYFRANNKTHKIEVYSTNYLRYDEATSAAKDAGIIQFLEESFAEDVKNQRQRYLDDYNAATTLEDIKTFETNYATNDPDGFIPLLQPKKKELTYAKYKNAFDNAKSPDDLSLFIKAYENNDPDGLVPLANNKLDAIRVSEEKQRLADKEAKESSIRAEKEAKKTELARLTAQAIAKHGAAIKSLGFSTSFLKANLYIYTDSINRPVSLFSFETWLALLFESGKYSNIKKVEVRGAQGVLLKRPGMQSGGILFKLDGGDLFPSHTTNGDKAFPIKDANDQVAASMMMLSAFQ